MKKTSILITKFKFFIPGIMFSFLFACGTPVQKKEPKIPDRLIKAMAKRNMPSSSPLLIRIFKKESKLEIWKQTSYGHYDLLVDYNICKYSGRLGPKLKEGDRQAPEGFYFVPFSHLNPDSDHHLAFNIGFPNPFDRSHGWTGSNLMIHGGCSSSGCYSMTNRWIEEIYALVHHSLKNGQKEVQVQAFPFRMTIVNMMKYETHPHYEFWQNLKEGYDYFETIRRPPEVSFCEKRYAFNIKREESVAFLPFDSCPAPAQNLMGGFQLPEKIQTTIVSPGAF